MVNFLNNKKISTLIGTVIILAVAIIAFAGILVLEKSQIPVVVETKNTVSKNIDIKDWKTYTNTEYGFEFQYPIGYEISVAGKGASGRWDDRNVLSQVLISDESTKNQLYTKITLDVGMPGLGGLREWGNFKKGQIDGSISCANDNSFCEIIFSSKFKPKQDFYINFYTKNKYNQNEDNIINKILSTFKFTK